MHGRVIRGGAPTSRTFLGLPAYAQMVSTRATKFDTMTQVGSSVFLGENHAPYPKFCPNLEWERKRVSKGSATPSSQRVVLLHPQFFYYPLHARTRLVGWLVGFGVKRHFQHK